MPRAASRSDNGGSPRGWHLRDALIAQSYLGRGCITQISACITAVRFLASRMAIGIG